MKKETQDWLSIFDKWGQSSLSQKFFCKEQGLSYSQFYHQRRDLLSQGLVKNRRFERLKKKSIEPSFIPVTLASPMPKVLKTIEIQLPYGIVLRIPTDVAA